MGAWHPAQVPGDIHLDLLRNKVISDPFYRDNEAKLQWISRAEWEYRTTVTVTPEMLRRQHLDLVFEGLDTACEVHLNDKLVLKPDNMFRRWEVDAKPVLKLGANQLRLVFPPPDQAAEKVAALDPWWKKTMVAAKTYVRKAAYEYGWDWGPTFVTSGIWRPVFLRVWDQARISDLHLRQLDIATTLAHVSGQVEVTAAKEGEATVVLDYGTGNKTAQVSRAVTLHAGVNHIEIPLEVKNPELWFPNGYGAHPLYVCKAQLALGRDIVDTRETRIGLRSVVLRREVDQWGRSFEFVINGIPVFAKGADVIPFDSFPNRVTTADYRRILESAVATHMNMIRAWGGGYYETKEFYDLCDELGLMVWQDFMFGNEMQPGTYPFKLSVAQEAADQLRRLRNHPSIVLWCGNNEQESRFRWGGASVPTDPATLLQMWKDYITISSGVLGQAVKELAPETPYWPSSPTSDFEETSSTYASGDEHDWSVWHGEHKPFAVYLEHHFRFVSEYGFQSFPDARTVESYTLPADRAGILTPVMLAHQKADTVNGNELIHKYMSYYYPEPKDFASFLYMSQVLQAEGVKVGAEHLRRDRPRCMGSIFWQLNDCWPVASWSSIDYYGRWKALQYYAARFYAPLLISPCIEDGDLNVYIVSDQTQLASGSVRVRLLRFDGTVLRDETMSVEVTPLSSHVYWNAKLDQLVPPGVDPTTVFAVTELVVGSKEASCNLVYLRPTKEIHLPVAHITAKLSQGSGFASLRLTSDVLARSVQVSFGKSNAEPDDNYFDLLPGEPRDIQIKGTADIETLRQALAIQSLADAFAPADKSPAQSSPKLTSIAP